MKNYSCFNFDLIDIGIAILMFFIGLSVTIFVSNGVKDSDEKSCVRFYEEHNGYILKTCEKYKDKLVVSNE